MSEAQKGEKKAFDPADYPTLRDYLPGYLHQDFAVEYGTPSAAIKAFVEDASGDEIVQVREEWKVLRAKLAGQPIEETQAALVALGCAWRPASEEELKNIDEILVDAKT